MKQREEGSVLMTCSRMFQFSTVVGGWVWCDSASIRKYTLSGCITDAAAVSI